MVEQSAGRRVIAWEWMSLDGVIQSPSTPAEDRDGGFAHGGWHPPYFDDLSRQWVADGLDTAGAFLFGRRTYDIFAAHWPNVTGPESALAAPLNSKVKYLVSRTPVESLGWQHSELLLGDAARSVATLKMAGAGNLHLIGSAALARTLFAHGMIDELRLMVDPVRLGGGKRLFPEDGELASFTLLDSRVTTTGALLLHYRGN